MVQSCVCVCCWLIHVFRLFERVRQSLTTKLLSKRAGSQRRGKAVILRNGAIVEPQRRQSAVAHAPRVPRPLSLPGE